MILYRKKNEKRLFERKSSDSGSYGPMVGRKARAAEKSVILKEAKA